MNRPSLIRSHPAAVCAIAGSILLSLRFGYAAAPAFAVATVAAIGAAVAEWCPINNKADDNFTVPLVTSAVAALAFALL